MELNYIVLGSGISVSLTSSTAGYYYYVSNLNNEKRSWTSCLPIGDYQFSLYSLSSIQVSYTLKVDGVMMRKYNNLKFIKWENCDFSLPLIPKVDFDYPNLEIYTNQYFIMQPLHKGTLVCDEYALFDSDLPYGLELNTENGNIEGISESEIKVSVLIKCMVSTSIVTVKYAIINIRSCSEGIPFSIVINSGSTDNENIIVTLTDNENNEYISLQGMLASSTLYYSFCYVAKEYTLEFRSSDNIWPTGTSITAILDGYDTKYTSQRRIKDTISSNDFDIWEYSDEFEPDWFRKPTSWNKFYLGDIPSRVDQIYTYYFKRNFYYTVNKDVMYYVLDVIHDGGVVVYVNGEIVHKYKITNSYNQNSKPMLWAASIGYAGPIKILPYNLKNGINTIAVEFHTNYTIIYLPFSLKIYSEKDTSKCKLVSYQEMDYYFNDNGYPEFGEKFENLMDGNIFSKYTPQTSNNKIGLWFGLYKNYPINRFDYFTTDSCYSRVWNDVGVFAVRYPRMMADGRLDGPEWINNINYILKIDDIKMNIPVLNDAQYEFSRIPFYMFSYELPTIESIQAIYFNITSLNDKMCKGTNTRYSHVSELRFYSCKPSFCYPSDKVPKFGYEGTVEEVFCSVNNGKIKYQCLKNGNWGAISNENICSNEIR